ncbi:inositol monophosphatase [bacterium]|nr:MAG: inositol monophosphatase [bacterium]
MLEIAVTAALAAGKIQRERFGGKKEIRKKGIVDLVTDVDIACEERVREILLKATPSVPVLGEEEGMKGGRKVSSQWIVDPIDGTTNFAHGIPIFCVSLALEEEGEITVGVIYDPLRDELFTAEKGKGACLGGCKMSVTKTAVMEDSLLATGFPYDNRTNPKDIFGAFAAVHKSTRGLRRLGSAAIDLAYVAAGRLDGFWEVNLKPWDVAAGKLLVEEAGGKVTGFHGEKYDHMSGDIVASNGLIHEELLKILARHF